MHFSHICIWAILDVSLTIIHFRWINAIIAYLSWPPRSDHWPRTEMVVVMDNIWRQPHLVQCPILTSPYLNPIPIPFPLPNRTPIRLPVKVDASRTPLMRHYTRYRWRWHVAPNPWRRCSRNTMPCLRTSSIQIAWMIHSIGHVIYSNFVKLSPRFPRRQRQWIHRPIYRDPLVSWMATGISGMLAVNDNVPTSSKLPWTRPWSKTQCHRKCIQISYNHCCRNVKCKCFM